MLAMGSMIIQLHEPKNLMIKKGCGKHCKFSILNGKQHSILESKLKYAATLHGITSSGTTVMIVCSVCCMCNCHKLCSLSYGNCEGTARNVGPSPQ